MPSINIKSDAFSHGQIKSKMWMATTYNIWAKKHIPSEFINCLNWYGSWVGVGAFVFLGLSETKFTKIRLFDLDEESLNVSRKILDFWHCETRSLETNCADINNLEPDSNEHQLFINTACEHVKEDTWLKKLPTNSYILLQSTDMPHHEHINCPTSLDNFVDKYSKHIDVLEKDHMLVTYIQSDFKFNRFMLLGRKK